MITCFQYTVLFIIVYCTFSFGDNRPTGNIPPTSADNLHAYERIIWKEDGKDTFLTQFLLHMHMFY